jgi:hypothetical protein
MSGHLEMSITVSGFCSVHRVRSCGRDRPVSAMNDASSDRCVVDAYTDTSRAEKNKEQVTDRHNQHRLSNSMSLSDKCNRWKTGKGYALQQIFLTCTGAITRVSEDGR